MFWKRDQVTEFIEAVQSTDFEDYGTFLVNRIERNDKDLYLECSLKLDEDVGFHEKWSVICHGVRKSRIEIGYFDRVYLTDEHILLVEYTDKVQTLSFHGRAGDVSHVVGALYTAHSDLADDWIPLTAFLLDRKPDYLIDGGYGILASGPALFIRKYQQVLESNGFRTSICGESNPTEWNGSASAPFPVLQLLVMDRSFVIAESFSARKI